MSKTSLSRNQRVAIKTRAIKESFRYMPPNDEQLLNFVCALIGAHFSSEREIISAALRDFPETKMRWLRKHKEMQESLNQ